MAAVRNRRIVNRAEYVTGSAVRKLEPAREPMPGRKDPRQRNKQARRPQSLAHTMTVRRNQEKALQMNLPYVLLLTAAAVCVLYLCVSYLQLQADVSARMKRIESLESDIETLKSSNDAKETSINTSVDLDYIYKVATEELGMVYANKDQVRLYNKTESEYVRQYEDIPER